MESQRTTDEECDTSCQSEEGNDGRTGGACQGRRMHDEEHKDTMTTHKQRNDRTNHETRREHQNALGNRMFENVHGCFAEKHDQDKHDDIHRSRRRRRVVLSGSEESDGDEAQ